MSMEDKYEEIPVHKFFLIRPANEWMAMTRGLPILKKLFGDFWFESELAVLFAETNAGKSILAVQIADSISRGVDISPFVCDAGAQKVLYFDFELSERQFFIRYSEDGENMSQFNDNFIWLDIDSDGNSSREIAREIDISHTQVNRLLKEMFTDEMRQRGLDIADDLSFRQRAMFQSRWSFISW